jgi:shikimate kinase
MMRIFLIGYMGAGKTTLGKALARRMNLSFVDTDLFIERRYRKKTPEIFATEGEAYFREIEHRILQELTEFEDTVVSTGGGLPCFYDHMMLMNRAGITVYLNVSVKALAARLEVSKNIRPILRNRSGTELIDFIKESLNRRESFYRRAKIRFDAEQMETKNEVEALAEQLQLQIALHQP